MKAFRYWKRVCIALQEPCEMMFTALIVFGAWIALLQYGLGGQ